MGGFSSGHRGWASIAFLKPLHSMQAGPGVHAAGASQRGREPSELHPTYQGCELRPQRQSHVEPVDVVDRRSWDGGDSRENVIEWPTRRIGAVQSVYWRCLAGLGKMRKRERCSYGRICLAAADLALEIAETMQCL